MAATFVEIGYGASAAAFLALLVLTAFSRIQSTPRSMLLVVAGANIVWALAIIGLTLVPLPSWSLIIAEVGRIASWLVFSVVLLGLLRQSAAELWLLKVLGVTAPVLLGAYILLQPVLKGYTGIEWLPSGDPLWLMFPIAGLLLLENLYRNADSDTRWATKHLCLGIGFIYAYDFFYFAEAVLFGRADATLYAGRGFISAMMVPLIAVSVMRARTWPLAIQLSRRVVFHSFVLFGAGLYLLIMSAVGLYVRRLEGDWGAVLQVVFLVGAVAMLIVIFASSALRARMQLFISRNFFSLKYDYRETWMHFIRTLSSGDPNSSLQRRLLDAVSGLMESTGAGLWVRSADEGTFVPVATWNLGPALPSEPAGSPFGDWLSRHHDVIELSEAADANRYPGLCIPDWLRTLRRAWLVVPLMHRDQLQGFIVLGEPRSDRHLDWEDCELLQAIGRQAASYVAEEQSLNSLADARQIEAFSHRFAFIAHDLKNIVGQLSLLLRNAERYNDNPEFRQDMLATVSHSVKRMGAMLQQLQSISQGAASDVETVPLGELLHELSAAWLGAGANFSADLASMPGSLLVPKEQFRSVVEHLLQNAFDATGADGRVTLRTRTENDCALIEVEDDGPGMDPDFVRHKLFRPFQSTRVAGFGLGAYQVREQIRSLGGCLDVRSEPGAGTTMQIRLPLTGSPRTGPAVRLSEEVDS
jgi:putative PEP-CTERM system histidine kinase